MSALAVTGGVFALALVVTATPSRGQEGRTTSLSLTEALAIAQSSSPVVDQAAFDRSAASGGLWEAYGNLLPTFDLQSFAQKSEAGTFTLGGAPFQSPETYTTSIQWNLNHSLLDAGRDLFRIRGARARAARAASNYDAIWWTTRADVKRDYIQARRFQALEEQAGREIERLEQHLQLARTRLEVGAVTRSDVLQAELALNQGRVAELEAAQATREALLALRSRVGGLPAGAISLAGTFPLFSPPFDVEALVRQAVASHPTLEEIRAQEAADHANLWIARSTYLPSLRLQYTLSRSVADTSGFKFSDFDSRDFWAVSLNWALFDGFGRVDETSRANAALQSSRAEERRRALEIEESVRSAHGRLLTAYAAAEANQTSVALADEDLRLGEARYETGAGSFVDLLDARVRATGAEAELIASRYDFYLALVELERSTGLDLFPVGVGDR